MQYLLLIYEDEKIWTNMSEAEQGEIFMGYKTFTDEIKAGGQHKGGEALQPSSTATSVRVREGKTLTTDGPFAETREQLGGFYLIDAKDLDEALAIAAKIPAAKTGTIEVRPILTFDM
jgi:hypothetical protein